MTRQYSRQEPIDLSGTKENKKELIGTTVSIDIIYKNAEVDLGGRG